MIHDIHQFPHVEKFEPQHGYEFQLPCIICKESYPVFIPAQELYFLNRRELNIQDACPSLEPHERELIMNGICKSCYSELFPPDDPPETECTFDPTVYAGQPIGMFHCPECGEMVLAGLPH